MFLFPFANYGILKTQISMGLAPAKASRIRQALEDSHWVCPDPRSIDDIKLCTATMDLGSV